MALLKYFVLSDIHGQYEKLEQLLRFWNPDTEQLVLNGDYIDRGFDSYLVLKRVQELHRQYGAIVNRGNHEDMFLNWLENPINQSAYYFGNGGKATIFSFVDELGIFYKSTEELRDQIMEKSHDLIQFIQQMNLYKETDRFLFVHAGVNLYMSDWRKSDPSDFLWIRDAFIYTKNQTDKFIVFGHTPTFTLHDSEWNTKPWLDRWGTKLCIDGGAGYEGGKLYGSIHLVISYPYDHRYANSTTFDERYKKRW